MKEQQNSSVFNASLKEKLESLNRSTRPLPDIPSKKGEPGSEEGHL